MSNEVLSRRQLFMRFSADAARQPDYVAGREIKGIRQTGATEILFEGNRYDVKINPSVVGQMLVYIASSIRGDQAAERTKDWLTREELMVEIADTDTIPIPGDPYLVETGATIPKEINPEGVTKVRITQSFFKDLLFNKINSCKQSRDLHVLAHELLHVADYSQNPWDYAVAIRQRNSMVSNAFFGIPTAVGIGSAILKKDTLKSRVEFGFLMMGIATAALVLPVDGLTFKYHDDKFKTMPQLVRADNLLYNYTMDSFSFTKK